MTQQLKHSHAKRDAQHKKLLSRPLEGPAGILTVKETDARPDPGLQPLGEPTYTPLAKRRRGDKVALEDI